MPNMVEGSFAKTIQRSKRTLPGHLRRFTGEVSEMMVEDIKRRTPMDSGKLHASIRTIKTRKIPDGYTGGAQTQVKYASFVEYGTKPHTMEIAQNAKGHFVFFKNQKKVVTKKVEHPGTKAVHMFSKGAADTERSLRNPFERMITQWKASSGL